MDNINQNQWHPGTAAVLSFFMCGAGQIYKGKINRGLILFAIYAVAGAMLYVSGTSEVYERTAMALKAFGFVIGVSVWLVGIFDAFENQK